MVTERLKNSGSEQRHPIRSGARVHVAYAGARREPTFMATIRQIGYDFVRLDLYSLPT